MNNYKRFLKYSIIVMISLLIFWLGCSILSDRPDRYVLTVGERTSIEFDLPYSIKSDGNIFITKDGRTAHASVDSAVVVEGDALGSYEADMFLFGFIPAGRVKIDIVDKNMLYAGGNILGLKFDTEGALVVGLKDVNSDKINSCPARGILHIGDYIIMAGGIKVKEKEQLVSLIEKNGTHPMSFVVKRGNEYIDLNITPEKGDDNKPRIGAMIRDDMAGVGTLSFINPAEETFGMLGHGIYDVDTKEIVDFSEASAYLARTVSIKKGTKNNVGEIAGAINLSKNECVGKITANTNLGVFGEISNMTYALSMLKLSENDLYEIGHSSMIKKGNAYIISAALGERKKYDVEITEINYNRRNKEKSLKLTVTDKSLIKKTGGIIQGMSGSPIIQEGKIIGVVTHVSVENPKIGYGIFIDDMLNY